MTSHQLAAGELVLLLDSKARRYLVTLTEGKEFHSHSGYITHAEIIGAYEGDTLRSTRGASYTVMRPTLSEFILKMPRGAQVIYPKDIGPILMMADLGPGLRVLESGVGSGALSMAMLRCGAEIVGYEIREEFADRARENVAKFLGEGILDRYRIELRDCYEGIDEHDLDRVILDLPEPWNVVPHAATALRPGGLILGYSPSIVQVIQFRNALKAHRFVLPETIEVLNRGWYLEGAAVRPDHRMVAHTGFLTVARRGPRLDPLTEANAEGTAGAGTQETAGGTGPEPVAPGEVAELLNLLGVQDLSANLGMDQPEEQDEDQPS